VIYRKMAGADASIVEILKQAYKNRHTFTTTLWEPIRVPVKMLDATVHTFLHMHDEIPHFSQRDVSVCVMFLVAMLMIVHYRATRKVIGYCTFSLSLFLCIISSLLIGVEMRYRSNNWSYVLVLLGTTIVYVVIAICSAANCIRNHSADSKKSRDRERSASRIADDADT
jgi:hypothetical protein